MTPFDSVFHEIECFYGYKSAKAVHNNYKNINVNDKLVVVIRNKISEITSNIWRQLDDI